MRRAIALLSVLLIAAVAGCGDDDAGQTTPPYGLTLDQPGTAEDILATLASMPAEVSGLSRSQGEHPFILQYGDSNSIVAIPLVAGDAPLAEDLGRFQLEPGAQVEDIQLGGSDLVWLVGSFPDGGGAGTVYLAVWGHPNGEWAFNVSAASPAVRDEIARAFADAAG